MKDSPDPYFKLPLLQRASPILGAICFGALMYVSMAFDAREKPVFAVSFILVGIAAVVAGRRLTKPYTPSAFGFYIFACSSVIFGGMLFAAQA